MSVIWVALGVLFLGGACISVASICGTTKSVISISLFFVIVLGLMFAIPSFKGEVSEELTSVTYETDNIVYDKNDDGKDIIKFTANGKAHTIVLSKYIQLMGKPETESVLYSIEIRTVIRYRGWKRFHLNSVKYTEVYINALDIFDN